jgi:hypothetical protein
MSEIFRQLDYQRWITYREGPLGTPRPRSIPAGWRKAAYKSKPPSGFQGYNKSKSVGAANGPPAQFPDFPYQKVFLRQKVPEFDEPGQWKGVKILGQGYGRRTKPHPTSQEKVY